MIEIKGKVNTAICYATVVEDEAIEQIRRMCDHDFTAGSQIRIMPDVHAGKGCTIGTTMTITDKAVPNIVGVDIGCGMYTAELGKVDVDFEKVDAAAHYIPSGRDVWEGRMERFDLTGLRCYRNLKQAKRLERSLGTLGGGNHFIEIDAASDGTKYLVIHSGSRNLGKQVAELYQTLAIDLNAGKADYFERRDELIRTYKEQGRRAEIQTALKAMEKEWAAKEPTIPADLCYLYGTYLVDVLILDRFGVARIGHTTDAVRPHTLIRDAVLRRCFLLIRSVRSCDGGFDLFSFGAGQLFLFGQFDTPPGLTGFAAPERHKNCWSYTGAALASGSTRGRCCG